MSVVQCCPIVSSQCLVWCARSCCDFTMATTRLLFLLVVGFTGFYRPQRSCGQGYVFTRVCDSVHRGGVSGQPPPPRSRENPLPPGPGRPPPPPPGRRLQHTVNERPVRILLECILVHNIFRSFYWMPFENYMCSFEGLES